MGKTKKSKSTGMSKEEEEMRKTWKELEATMKAYQESVNKPRKKKKKSKDKKRLKSEAESKSKEKSSSKAIAPSKVTTSSKGKATTSSKRKVTTCSKRKVTTSSKKRTTSPSKGQSTQRSKGKATSQSKRKEKTPPPKAKPKPVEVDDETSSSSEEEDDEVEELMLMDMRLIFRKWWSPAHEPICILGSVVRAGTILILVRIKSSKDEDVEAVKKDPFEGLNAKNCYITKSSSFAMVFPHVLIKYYQDNVLVVESTKDPETTAKDVATALRHHDLLTQVKSEPVEGGPIYREMMTDLAEHLGCKDKETNAPDGEAIAGCSTAEKKVFECKRAPLDKDIMQALIKQHKESKQLIRNTKAELEESIKQGKEKEKQERLRKDEFGLPYWYGESDYSDYVSTSSNAEESSS